MELKDFIHRIGTLPKTSEELLLTAFKRVHCPKGQCLLQEHNRSHRAYVIKRGIAYAYTMKNGKSVTFWIGREGDIIYPGQSLHYHSGEYGTVVLIEDCELYELNLDKLHTMYLEDVNLANWGRMAAEKECIALEKSILSRQTKSALERYKDLLNEHPEIVKRVPLHVIASYLNVTQEHLSRIRGKIR